MTWLTRKNGNEPAAKVNALFDQMMDDFFKPESPWSAFKTLREKADTFPQVDLKEKDGKLQVKAELPGVDENDIKLTLDHQNLIISGEKKSEQEKEEDGYHYKECSYGSFRRVIGLPYEVDQEQVKASFKNGVLNVDMEKDAKLRDRTRTISIGS